MVTFKFVTPRHFPALTNLRQKRLAPVCYSHGKINDNC